MNALLMPAAAETISALMESVLNVTIQSTWPFALMAITSATPALVSTVFQMEIAAETPETVKPTCAKLLAFPMEIAQMRSAMPLKLENAKPAMEPAMDALPQLVFALTQVILLMLLA